jgi:hypothetical protein
MDISDESKIDVYLDEDGIINLTPTGDMARDVAVIIGSKYDKLALRMRNEGRPVLVFADLSRLGKVNSEARKVAGSFDAKFDAYVIYGARPLMKMLLQLAAHVNKGLSRLKVYDDKEAGLAYLKSLK